MLGLGYPTREKNRTLQPILQETNIDVAIFYFLLHVGCYMKHVVIVVVGIFHHRIEYLSHLYTFFSCCKC